MEVQRLYPVELYHGEGHYRVVWSPEEHDKLVKKGYQEEREDGKKYVPFTAVGVTPNKPKPATVPSVDDVLALGYDEEAAAKIVEEEQRKQAAGEFPYPPVEKPKRGRPAKVHEE